MLRIHFNGTVKVAICRQRTGYIHTSSESGAGIALLFHINIAVKITERGVFGINTIRLNHSTGNSASTTGKIGKKLIVIGNGNKFSAVRNGINFQRICINRRRSDLGVFHTCPIRFVTITDTVSLNGVTFYRSRNSGILVFRNR